MSAEREVLTTTDAYAFLNNSRNYVIRNMSESGLHDFDALRILTSAMASVQVGAEGIIY